MTVSSDKNLVFRIAGVGFALPLDDLVEIREAGAGVLDRSDADPENGLLGRLEYRDETIHAVNVRQKFGLPVPESFEAAYVVVHGVEGVWALPVDKIEGIFPAEQFTMHELPLLLRLNAGLPYGTLQVWRCEPMIRFEPLRVESFGEMP